MLRFLPLTGCWLAAGLFLLPSAVSATQDEDRVRTFIVGRPGGSLRSRLVPDASQTVNVTVGLMDIHVHTTEDRPAPSSVDARATVNAWLWVEWTDHRLNWSELPDMNSVRSVRIRMKTSSIWTPSIQVLDAIHKSPTVFPAVIEAVVKQAESVMVVVPVRFEVPLRFSGPSSRRPDTCLFTLGSVLTSMDLVDFNPSGSKFIADVTFLRDAKEGTIRRREVTRGCCSERFAVLEFRVVF